MSVSMMRRGGRKEIVPMSSVVLNDLPVAIPATPVAFMPAAGIHKPTANAFVRRKATRAGGGGMI